MRIVLSVLLVFVSVFVLVHVLMHNQVTFFFNDTATTKIYTLSLHDALPISNFLKMAFFEDDNLLASLVGFNIGIELEIGRAHV